MKKVAIMTIQSINIGNRLQNYALQEVIKKLGYDVYTIRRKKHKWPSVKTVLEEMKDFFRTLIGTRKGLYIRFDKMRIRFGRQYALVNETTSGLADTYDFFVAGSDQVWNPYYGHLVGSSDLLLFARERQKVSYAASFGVDEIPAEKKEIYSEALRNFKEISVREEAGARIVKNLIGREAAIVLDPTLLLDISQYKKIQKRPRDIPGRKYILVYLLGGKSKIFTEYMKKNKEHDGYELYDILQWTTSGRQLPVGPAEFIYLVNNSEMVLTDSFHATVFAVIFHKPVKTFPREGIDISSRIVTLAALLGLKTNFTEDEIFYINKDEDYKLIDKHLGEEKKKSIGFLKRALE